MKRLIGIALAVGVVAIFSGAALAQMYGPNGGAGRGAMMGGPMMQGMGPGGFAGGGPGNCGLATGATAQTITEEKAKEVAQQYVDAYLKGFTIERVLPTTGMRHTMYVVELKGPKGEARTLHVNPWGGVRPFGGPVTVQ